MKARAATIDRLPDPAPPGFAELVADSEGAGVQFLRRLLDEWVSGTNRFDRPGEALFGAWLDGRLVGVCGLNLDPYAADPRVGRVRHLYVLATARRRGVGRMLVTRVIEAAGGRFETLRLSTSNPAAARLYEMLGFRAVVAGDCTHVLAVDAPGASGKARRCGAR